MITEQSMPQTIMQAEIKVTKAPVIALREADNLVNNARQIHTMPRSGSTVLRQQTFDWNVANKYQDLCNFEIEVKTFS